MELKVQVRFKLGDTVYWMDNDDSRWWYNHLFTGVIKNIIISDSGIQYYAETTAAENILTKTDETNWHVGGGGCDRDGRYDGTKFFTDKQKLLEANLPSRLKQCLAQLTKQLESTTEKLKSLQKTLKEGPGKLQELKDEIANYKRQRNGISKRLRKIQ